MTAHASPAVLDVADLTVRFRTPTGLLTAVDQLSFSVSAGETLAIVGESGCGKSVTAMALLRLLRSPPAEIGGRHVLFEGQDLLRLRERALRNIRGNRIAMIFQDPLSALNPVLTVGDQIIETLKRHTGLRGAAAHRRAVELLDLVRIPEPARRASDYPHRFSGGMRQRAMIAIALAASPAVLIADEPTTALDVTVQAQILKLLNSLQRELGMALILISHDLGVVAETADRVLVMYAGRKVEERSVLDLFAGPLHPYTRALMRARPRPEELREFLDEIPGIVPSLADLPPGCAFAPRCSVAYEACSATRPALLPSGDGGAVACIRAPLAAGGVVA
ncbi:ABC transporter ATP-binding protein [Azorhizobium oxalatiphilum]|uniref:ABC transporter ATP-binding protein n=1 Tax=Azorhizobium oxalatiphilum TaxID=980631 RepID=A0A917FAW1_9HYPH|nr:ABC transporter ATP-binding protein [Azorhizobium oxalatiphilum]GGF58536.1 ABC transporter ATP-binding protein [Azorhizobium oxalatiphilum]